MALFELEEGRLVPAQFGKEVKDGFDDRVLSSVRSQVLEIISRPLFPITWRDIARPDGSPALPRLTALDASGQVVAVEVIESLDAELLIDSLSRLSDTAAMSWVDLAREHPGSIEGFKVGWAQFRQSMPSSPPNGPRLIIVAASISDDVRPALDVLSSSGVEVHEMSLRHMSNGRAFLDVSVVGPRLYGHRANLLMAETSPTPQVAAKTTKAPKESSTKTEAAHFRPTGSIPSRRSLRQNVSAQPNSSASWAASTRTDPIEASPIPRVDPVSGVDLAQKAVPVQRDVLERRERKVSPLPSRVTRQQRERSRAGYGSALPIPTSAQSSSTGRLTPSSQALDAVGALVGRPTPLSLSPARLTPQGAALSADGWIYVPSGRYKDPTQALVAEGVKMTDGWSAWHLGDEYGPTLIEAVEEINRDR